MGPVLGLGVEPHSEGVFVVAGEPLVAGIMAGVVDEGDQLGEACTPKAVKGFLPGDRCSVGYPIAQEIKRRLHALF